MRTSVFALCLLVACVTFAQEYKTGGSIVDPSGEAAEFVNVLFLDVRDSTLVSSALSDSAGRFQAALPPAKYILKFTGLGFKTAYAEADVAGDSDLGIFTLERDGIVLEAVTATGNRPAVRRTATGITVSVKDAPYLQNKTLDWILNMSPGVFVDKNGKIRINGIEGATVIVNDRTIKLSGEQLAAYFESMQGSDVKQIEIISNPTSAYDAEGAGGVVRISAVRKRNAGIGGNVASSFSYSDAPFFNELAGLYVSNGRNFTVYGNYTFKRNNAEAERYTDDRFGNGNRNSTVEAYSGQGSSHTFRAGMDWLVAKNHYIGLEYNGLRSSQPSEGRTLTEHFVSGIYSGADRAETSGDRNPGNNLVNVNYLWRIDTLGQQLKLVADYSDVNNAKNINNYRINYLDDRNSLIGTEEKNQESGEWIDIYSAQLDYETRFRTKEWKFSAGAKYSGVETDYRYNLRYCSPDNPGWEEDGRFKDDFHYTETRYAAYANAAYAGSKMEANAGLRAEYTRTESVSRVSDEKNSGDDFRLFPSAFFYYRPGSAHGFMAYYGMRIQRPNYEMVNPYTFYLTESSVKRGNPGLKPVITNAVELTYVLKNRYYLAVKAQFQNDAISDYVYEENGVSITTTRNMSRKDWYYVNAYLPFDYKTWSCSVMLNAGVLNSKNGIRSMNSFSMDASVRNYMRLPKGFGLTLNFLYMPPKKDVFMEWCWHVAKLDLGVDYTFWKGRMTLSAGVDDIFDTLGEAHFKYYYDNMCEDMVFKQNRGRTFRVGLRVNFSAGGRSGMRQKETSNTDEMNRL